MSGEETISAATAIISDLARAVGPFNPPEFDPHSNIPATNYHGSGKVLLPGNASAEKRTLETELTALAARIRYLEDKAATVNNQVLPDTPNENGAPISPFGANGSVTPVRNGNVVPVRQSSGAARNSHVSSLLAVRANGRTFSEEDLGHLRDHVKKQAEEIKSQRDTIVSVGEQLHEQQEKAAKTFVKVENEDINRLQRELLKHQQANEAFQKALKEIGTIITNVAKGDLGHKVQIHAVEMDPEITVFKRTINTMMDQLQVFGSEVSRVAREVGTEGNLGGQAHITGVSGIWKELTENGKHSRPPLLLSGPNSRSECHGQQSNLASPRNCGSHNGCSKRKFGYEDTTTSTRRDPSASANHQYHGRPVTYVCHGSHKSCS